jgi:hypothetical protein
MPNSTSSDSSSSYERPKFYLSMSICDGAYEDCAHCNANKDSTDEKESENNDRPQYYGESDEESGGSVRNREVKSVGDKYNDYNDCEFQPEFNEDGEPIERTAFYYDEYKISSQDILITEANKDTFKQTPESCELSVRRWGPSIMYVKDEFVTYDLCKKAIKQTDHSIECIKRELLTPEEYYKLCILSVKKNGFDMKYIPSDVQTQELCDAAIKSGCWAIEYCDCFR